MFNNYYDVFESIKGNTENYIDWIKWNGSSYDTVSRTFDDIYHDVMSCYGRVKELGLTKGCTIAFEIENTYDCLLIDSALLLTGVKTIISNKKEKTEILDERSKEFNAQYIITERTSAGANGETVISYDSIINNNGSSFISKPLEFDDDISIMFSSGTTGIPKALGITGDGSIWSSNNFFRFMEFTTADKFLIFMPLSNYQQRFLFWGCLMNNVNISLGNDMTLFHDLVMLEPSILLAPPNFFYNLYREQQMSKDDIIRAALGSKMTYLLTGMAAIDNSVLEFFHDHGNEIYQIYGQTEIGMIACNTKKVNKLGSVGRPIIELNVSENGEIITNSPFPIVSGYYENGSLISRMSKKRGTGDIGRVDESGFVYIEGRINDTIVLNNGKKINPIHIENQLRNLVTAKEVVVYKDKSSGSGSEVTVVIINGDENATLDFVIRNIPEIKSFSDDLRVESVSLDDSVISDFYTENGKFSRKKAIEYFIKAYPWR